MINAGALPLLREVNIENTERFDGCDMGNIHNETMLYGVSGMDFYLSLTNNNISRFHRDIALLTNATNAYYGLNRRSELEQLFGVAYFLITDGQEFNVPYGYSDLQLVADSHGEDYAAYRSETKTSLVHGFKKTIRREAWMTLDVIDRQQALLQSIVVEDETVDSELTDIHLDQDKVTCTVKLENVTQKGSTYITTAQDGGSIILYPERKDALENGELYISLKGTDFSCGDATDFAIQVYGISNGERTEYTGRLRGTNRKNHIYEGRHDWLINIGDIGEQGLEAIEIHLETAGEYSFDDIQCYFRSNEELEQSIAGLDAVEENLQIGTNSVSGTITTEQAEHILLSIPYSNGWSLKVDGKFTQIQKADDAFMMFDVEKGEHTIEMTYCTPGLQMGLLCGMVTLIIIICVNYFQMRFHSDEGTVARK